MKSAPQHRFPAVRGRLPSQFRSKSRPSGIHDPQMRSSLRLRISCGMLPHYPLLTTHFCFPFVFMLLQIPFPATPLFSHPYKTPGGVPQFTSKGNKIWPRKLLNPASSITPLAARIASPTVCVAACSPSTRTPRIAPITPGSRRTSANPPTPPPPSPPTSRNSAPPSPSTPSSPASSSSSPKTKSLPAAPPSSPTSPINSSALFPRSIANSIPRKIRTSLRRSSLTRLARTAANSPSRSQSPRTPMCAPDTVAQPLGCPPRAPRRQCSSQRKIGLSTMIGSRSPQHEPILVGSGLRNPSLCVVLTTVRVFASVKERSASPLQQRRPCGLRPREKTFAQRHHHPDDGLRNERPPGRHVEGSHSKNQSGSDHRRYHAQRRALRSAGRGPGHRLRVFLFSAAHDSCRDRRSGSGHGAAALAGDRRKPIFCGAGQWRAFRDLRARGKRGRAERYRRPLFLAARQQNISWARHFCAHRGLAIQRMADRQYGRRNHGPQKIRAAQAESHRRRGERHCDARRHVRKPGDEFPCRRFAGKRADQRRSEISGWHASRVAYGPDLRERRRRRARGLRRIRRIRGDRGEQRQCFADAEYWAGNGGRTHQVTSSKRNCLRLQLYW